MLITYNWALFFFYKTLSQIWVNLDMYSDLLSSMGTFCKERTKKSVCMGRWLSLSSSAEISSLLILYIIALYSPALSVLFFDWPCDIGNCFKICPIFNEGQTDSKQKKTEIFHIFPPNIWNHWVHYISTNISIEYLS